MALARKHRCKRIKQMILKFRMTGVELLEKKKREKVLSAD